MKTLSLNGLIGPEGARFHIMRAHHTTGEKHSHSFFELVYVTDGYCIHTSGGLNTLLTEGDVFILRPGAAHSYTGNRVTHIYNCLFEASFLGGSEEELRRLEGLDALFSDANAPAVRLHLTPSERKRFLNTLDEMYEAYSRKEPGWEIWLRGRLLCLLTEYARACTGRRGADGTASPYPACVRQALAAIDTGYADASLTVHAIARDAGLSDDYLTRRFRAAVGITPCEYLRRYRFSRAMELLSDGLTVREVAEAVGFSRLSYFSREFTRELGVTPSKYRIG